MDGTSFEIGIGVTGGTAVDKTAASLDALSAQLEGAGAAATAASDALKAGEAAYKQAETSADRAAKALEKIGISADAQRGKLKAALDAGDAKAAEAAAKKLRNLVDRQAEAATKAASAKDAMTAEAVALDKLKAASGHAADAQAAMAKKVDAAKVAAKSAADAATKASGSGKANEAAEALGKLGGPLGKLGQQAFGAVGGLQKLGASLGEMGPYVAAAVVVVALVAGAAALAGAAISATVAVGAWAVSLADAGRTSALLSDGIARSVVGGRQLDATISKLGTEVPQTREELQAMASTLAATGLRGDALSKALETAAVKAAKLKYGPDFAKQTLSLDSQVSRLHTNIAALFGGLHIDALLAAMAKLVGLFDATGASGKAIKVVFESLFQPLIDGITSWVPPLVAAFLQFEILVLKALIAIKPFAGKLLLLAEILGAVTLVMVAMGVGFALAVIAPFVAAGIVIAAVVGSVILFGLAVYDAATKAYAFGAAIIGGASTAFDWLKTKVKTATDFLSSLSLSGIGGDLMAGLADGIIDGGDAVLKAITGAVDDATKAAKAALGIASPSKVFHAIGLATGEGMAAGVDASSNGVQTALESMAAPPPAGGPPPAPVTAQSGPTTFNFYGVAGAEEGRDMFIEALESMRAQLGGGIPNG